MRGFAQGHDSLLAADPRPALETLRIPVLALTGELDVQVPVRANLGAITRALRYCRQFGCTVEMLPGLNHLLQPPKTGGIEEYAMIGDKMSPEALARIGDWISSPMRGGSTSRLTGRRGVFRCAWPRRNACLSIAAGFIHPD
jgi:hypothetical protein